LKKFGVAGNKDGPRSYLSFGRSDLKEAGRLWGLLTVIFQTLLTFALICLTWVFFRAESIGGAFHIIGQMFTGWDAFPEGMSRADFYRQYIFMGKSDYDFYWSLGGIALLLVAEYLYIQNYVNRIFAIENRFVRYCIQWFLIATALLLIIIFAKTDAQQFIYFQF
jgi:hypothetical protein